MNNESMNTTLAIVVDENTMAKQLNMSVHFLRKDRRGSRLVPYFRIGGSIRYSVARVQAALAELEEGGSFRGKRSGIVKSPA
jgi:tRNA G10  N-methylase Trm11